MLSGRGTVQKSPYDKKPSTTTSTRRPKDDTKDVHSKYEGSGDKETLSKRDSSTSRLSKEKLQKEDVRTKTRVREKLVALRSETEKMKRPGAVQARESHSTTRDVKPKTTKPVQNTSRSERRTPVASTTNAAAPRRTQLSFRASRTAEKPVITISSRENARKSKEESIKPQVRRKEAPQQTSARKQLLQTAKLPDKMNHPRKMDRSRNRTPQAQKVEEPKTRLGRDRTRTRTLSPTEVKVAKGEPLDNTPRIEDKKQNEVQIAQTASVIAGPSFVQSLDQGGGDTPQQVQESDDYNYEDDFEDYESDFEEESSDSESTDEAADVKHTSYTSSESDTESDSESVLVDLTPRQPVVEEEKKLDSGNYDLAERRRKGREMQEIKLAMERENEALKENRKTHVAEAQLIADDEGYEEGKNVDRKKFSSTSISIFNFVGARKRKQEKKATANARRRGEELLGMIHLDSMSFTLFDLPPIPYEMYMKSYGRSNTLQAHAQTNEDNLSEEVQTDEIVCKNKWTQEPVSFETKSEAKTDPGQEIIMFSQNRLGVGSDSLKEDSDSWKERMKVNTVRMNQFISSAGQAMLVLLEEGQKSGSCMLNRNRMEIPFSEGFISLGIESIPFLAGRTVTDLQFPHHHSKILFTVHKKIDTEEEETEVMLPHNSIIAVWNILEPSFPQKILTAIHEITASCFDPISANLVFAGLNDGSLCVWDLREQSYFHLRKETDAGDWILRSPTYSTAEVIKDKGHSGPVVAIKPLIDSDEESRTSDETDLNPIQICSLDEGGTIITWTVIQSYSHSRIVVQDLGLAHWSKVSLVFSSSIAITDLSSVDQNLLVNLICYDMQLDSRDHNHLYIATSIGYVVHCLKSGGKAQPPLYLPKWDMFTAVKCIEVFPNGKPYFLVACNEGTVRLYSQSSEKPLMTVVGTGDRIGEGPSIRMLQWSRSKPFIFYVLDNNSRIHVWDLSKSDIYPQNTIPFGTLSAMQLSPESNDVKNPPHMALATGPGRVEIHQLRQEYFIQSSNEINKELDKFMHYTGIL